MVCFAENVDEVALPYHHLLLMPINNHHLPLRQKKDPRLPQWLVTFRNLCCIKCCAIGCLDTVPDANEKANRICVVRPIFRCHLRLCLMLGAADNVKFVVVVVCLQSTHNPLQVCHVQRHIVRNYHHNDMNRINDPMSNNIAVDSSNDIYNGKKDIEFFFVIGGSYFITKQVGFALFEKNPLLLFF